MYVRYGRGILKVWWGILDVAWEPEVGWVPEISVTYT